MEEDPPRLCSSHSPPLLPFPHPPSPAPEKQGGSRRGHTRLKCIQVLTGDVVINHIFFQGGESEPVDWE